MLAPLVRRLDGVSPYHELPWEISRAIPQPAGGCSPRQTGGGRQRSPDVSVEAGVDSTHHGGMGKVIVKFKLTNLKDTFLKSAGARKARPRAVEVEALVDTGATRLYLKPTVIKMLGLERTNTVRPQTSNGDAIRYKYAAVQLELMGRSEVFEVIEVPANVPNLLGQVPLEVLDFVVDSKGQKLLPNPAHGGEQMTEEY